MRSLKNGYGYRAGLRSALAVGILWLLLGLTVKGVSSMLECGASEGSGRSSYAEGSSARRSVLRVIAKAASKAVFAVSF